MQKTQFKKVMFISLILFLASTATLLSLIFLPQLFQPKIGGSFQLNHNQNLWNFSENSKKINIVYFGYTQCPDVCPMSMATAAQTYSLLNSNEQKNVQFIFINVDTEHDTAENTTKYTQQFNSQFIGLFGSKTEIDSVVQLFKAGYTIETDANSHLGYSIAHTDRFFILDKKGYLIDSISSPRDAKIVLQKIKELL